MTGKDTAAFEATGLMNLRDLGGLPVTGGGRTRHRVVYRSEAPVGLDATQLEALVGLGIQSTLDLRDENAEDLFETPSLPSGVTRLVAGITPPANEEGKGILQQVLDGERLDYGAAELSAFYIQMLDDNPDRFGQAIGFLGEAENLPILIHCHAGKDRTGLVAALLLDVVGVPLGEIVADYELSTELRANRRRPHVEPVLLGHGTEWDRVAPLFAAPAEALEEALSWIEAEHGTARAYLQGPGGVSDEVLERLTAEFVEDRPAA